MERPAGLASLDAVAALAATGTLVHDSPRSRVIVARHDGVDLVVKRSRRQEASRWIQFTSLWRSGEGVRSHDLLTRLTAAGLPVPAPVAAFDRRRGGLVVESWLVYRYIDGDVCGPTDAPRIAGLLRQMHDAGWVHRDPHVKNFLKTSAGLAMVDVGAARPRRSAFARAFDVVLLDKCCPGSASAYPGFDPRSRWHRLARAYGATLVGWRRLKARLRARLVARG
jgi:heptose II phosphotransferase